MDNAWATEELRKFLHITDRLPHKNQPGSGVVVLGTYQRGSQTDAAQQAHVVEQILDRVLTGWRIAKAEDKEWRGLRDLASRAIAALEREQELEEKLGDASPRLSTSSLHPWVWGPARKLWQDGHYRAALHAAASNLNAQVQSKSRRFELSDKALLEQLLSLEPPAPGKTRLRVMPDDGTPAYRSAQEGAMRVAVGLFQLVRNDAAHGVGELQDTIALERLAALSMLARVLDDATINE